MNYQEYLLVCLMEECGEVQQAAAKLLRFGKKDHHPDNELLTNEKELLTEMEQCLTVFKLLKEEKIINSLSIEETQTIDKEKREKLAYYMNYSRDVGRLS